MSIHVLLLRADRASFARLSNLSTMAEGAEVAPSTPPGKVQAIDDFELQVPASRSASASGEGAEIDDLAPILSLKGEQEIDRGLVRADDAMNSFLQILDMLARKFHYEPGVPGWNNCQRHVVPRACPLPEYHNDPTAAHQLDEFEDKLLSCKIAKSTDNSIADKLTALHNALRLANNVTHKMKLIHIQCNLLAKHGEAVEKEASLLSLMLVGAIDHEVHKQK